MKRIIFGVLAAFVFSLASIGIADLLNNQDTLTTTAGQSSYTHDVGLPEPINPPQPPPTR
ncbi:MAG: hypothetical protein HYR55_15155 [Acidobacteria bacterium]|nr:hypothetical protein [Acidobacteriota bacterium]MBI3657115.1 hypothetical protein [Acidobacteriota bacterium]